MLPYYKFNKAKQFHGVPHTLEYRNGYRVATAPKREFGCSDVTELNRTLYDCTWMYGRVKPKPIAPFQPDFVQNDKIILTFDGFFRQKVLEPNSEQYDLIRKVKIMYFMEDDTITVVEPPYTNSGYPQGRIIRRSRIIKDPHRNVHLSWKDLNIGIELKIFGIIFHLTECDTFTKEFLRANGIELNDIRIPCETRQITQRPVTAPVNRSAWFRNSEAKQNACIVLSYESIRLEEKKQLSDCVSYQIMFYLEDGTISVKERKYRDESFDFCPFLIKRVKVPKYAKRLINRLIVAEDESFGDRKDDIDYIQPSDFLVGKEVNLLGHRFLIRDCDARTRKYYEEILKIQQADRVSIDKMKPIVIRNDVPKYIGFGTPEDSLTSCKNLVPREPRKNIVQYIVNANKYLRFGCVLDSARPEDQSRQFILKYSLADGKIGINELSVTNSGIQGGKFVSPQLIAKNDCYSNEPDYYTCKDLYIGAILNINCRRFIITSADLNDYRYMQENPELFSNEAINSVREYLISTNSLSSNDGERL